MKRAPSPFLIECSCFKEMALVGGSSFRAACLVSKSPLDGFAVGLTATALRTPPTGDTTDRNSDECRYLMALHSCSPH